MLAWALIQPGRAEKSRSPLALGWEASLCSSMGPPRESELVCTTEEPQAALPSSGQPLEGLVCPQILELGLLFLTKPRTPSRPPEGLSLLSCREKSNTGLGSLATCAIFWGSAHVPPLLRQGQLPNLWHSVQNENIGSLLKRQEKSS